MVGPRVLIVNSYSHRNKGDAAIVLGMAKTIRHYMPQAKLTVLSFTPEVDSNFYARWQIETLSNVLNPYPAKRTRLQTVVVRMPRLAIGVASALLGKSLSRQPTLMKALHAYRSADVIVGCGGGYLGGNKAQSLLHLFGLWLGKRYKKPTVLYAHSVEPFRSRPLLWATKTVLGQVELVMCRERNTFDYLSSLGVKTRLELVPDAAFLLDPVPRDRAAALLSAHGIARSRWPLVGMTLRAWHFPGSSSQSSRQAIYKAAIAQLASNIVKELDGEVVLFPQVTFGPLDDDRTIGLEAWELLSPDVRSHVHVLQDDFLAEELKGMIGLMDVFVGTRMHSNIFALCQRVPCIAIAYESKTLSIMEMAGMGRYVIAIEQATGDVLWDMFLDALRERIQIKVQLDGAISDLEKQACDGGKLIAELLGVSHG